MSNQRVIYEASLAKVGRKVSRAGLVVLALCLGGGLICLRSKSILDSPLIFIGFVTAGFLQVTILGFRLRKNAGVYRICIDDYGL
jgi:hypothetical protein